MTVEEAKGLLSYHSGRNPDFKNPKWENGFLGSLRPFTGSLNKDNFIEVMECLMYLLEEDWENAFFSYNEYLDGKLSQEDYFI